MLRFVENASPPTSDFEPQKREQVEPQPEPVQPERKPRPYKARKASKAIPLFGFSPEEAAAVKSLPYTEKMLNGELERRAAERAARMQSPIPQVKRNLPKELDKKDKAVTHPIASNSPAFLESHSGKIRRTVRDEFRVFLKNFFAKPETRTLIQKKIVQDLKSRGPALFAQKALSYAYGEPRAAHSLEIRLVAAKVASEMGCTVEELFLEAKSLTAGLDTEQAAQTIEAQLATPQPEEAVQ